jgi:hypothetical protein
MHPGSKDIETPLADVQPEVKGFHRPLLADDLIRGEVPLWTGISRGNIKTFRYFSIGSWFTILCTCKPLIASISGFGYLRGSIWETLPERQETSSVPAGLQARHPEQGWRTSHFYGLAPSPAADQPDGIGEIE